MIRMRRGDRTCRTRGAPRHPPPRRTSDAALHFVNAGFSLQSVCLAVLGGSTITLMTRMQHGTDSDPAKIVAAVVGGFLLAGLQLFHSILDSLLIFGAIHAGVAVTYADWIGWFGYTLVFNMLERNNIRRVVCGEELGTLVAPDGQSVLAGVTP